MCNLYSITTNQAAIIALFRVMNRYVGNLPPMCMVLTRRCRFLRHAVFGAPLYLGDSIPASPRYAQPFGWERRATGELSSAPARFCGQEKLPCQFSLPY